MNKFLSKVIDAENKLFTRFLSVYYRVTNRFALEESKVLISGLPRGGTTWLAEVLGTVPNSILFWEPFRPFRLYEMGLRRFSARLGWFPYLSKDEKWEKGYRFVDHVLDLKRLNYKSILKYNSFKSVLNSNYAVIKCVTSNLLLPWINKYKDIKVIFLVRHPCAVISSQFKHGAFDVAHSELERLSKGEYSCLTAEMRDAIAKLSFPEEKLAAIWCIQHIVPITEGIDFHKTHTVFYEEAVDDPRTEFTQIFSFLNVEIPEGTLNAAQKPSKTTVVSAEINRGGNQLAGWQKNLSASQINNILKTLTLFGIDLYDDGLMPIKESSQYKYLKQL